MPFDCGKKNREAVIASSRRRQPTVVLPPKSNSREAAAAMIVSYESQIKMKFKLRIKKKIHSGKTDF